MTTKIIRLQSITTVLTLSFASLLSSCSDTKSSQDAQVINLTATVPQISGPELIIGSPSMIKVGDLLVMDYFKGDSVLYIVDSKTMTNKGSFLTHGQGPGEFQRIVLLSTIPDNDDEIIMAEPTIGRISKVSLADIDNGKVTTTEINRNEGGFWQFVPLANGNYVSSHGYDEHPELLTEYSSDGTIIGRIGERPMPEKYLNERPVDITAAYQYILYPSPDGRHIVGVGDGESAVFYELEGDTLVEKASLFNAEADPDKIFRAQGFCGINGESDKPMGFSNAATGDDGVYIIYTDRSIKDDEFNAGNRILHYDYDGNLKRDFRLDKRVVSITAPDSDGIIYAVALDDCEPTIVTFDTK